MRRRFLVLFSYFFLPSLSFALPPVQTVDAQKFITNLSSTLAELQKKLTIEVIFPEKILANNSHQGYFANSDSFMAQRNSGYQINVDYAANCQGAHYCNVGYMRGEKEGKLELQENRQHKIITEKVRLAKNIPAYYTPGHAEGSYFPPMLQWQDNHVLYTLTWDDHFATKAALIIMANSAINHH